MKQLLCLLFVLPFLTQAQNSDSLAVVREVDSLIQLNRSLARQRNYDEAFRVIENAENKTKAAFGENHPLYAT